MKNKVFVFIVCALLGGTAMYFAMPMIMGGKGAPPAGAAAPGAGGPPGGGAAMAMPVEGVKIAPLQMAQQLTVTAVLEAGESATLKAETSGRVVEIPFTEGQPVKKNDVLFKLEDSVQRAAIAQAQANVALTRNNVKRYKELAGTRAVAKVQVEEAQASAATATANVALAQANLDKMTIRAPFDGVAGIRSVSVGDIVDPSIALVTVAQNSSLRVIFNLPERFLPRAQPGQTVNFTVESYPDRVFEAPVAAIDSTIDPTTRAVRVQAIYDNADAALLSGQFATLNFALTTPQEVLAIPDSAILPEGGQSYVFKVDEKSMVQKVPVQTGLRDGRNVEIVSGLTEGDTIVTAGQQKIFPGMPVKVLPPSKINVSPPPEEESAQ